MSKKTIKLIILSTLLLVLDLLTKYFFYDKQIGKNFWRLEPVFNQGISRGIIIPVLVVIIFSILALWLFAWMHIKDKAGWIVVWFLMAGALGNLIDRIMLGWVRDFISIWSFPVFNFADVFLNIWVLLFLINEFYTWKKTSKK